MASVPQHHRWVWATILIVSVFFMVSNRSSDESSPANAPLRTEQDVFTRWFGDSSRFTATEHSVGSGVVFQIEEVTHNAQFYIHTNMHAHRDTVSTARNSSNVVRNLDNCVGRHTKQS